jgi:hypothetical protein
MLTHWHWVIITACSCVCSCIQKNPAHHETEPVKPPLINSMGKNGFLDPEIVLLSERIPPNPEKHTR